MTTTKETLIAIAEFQAKVSNKAKQVLSTRGHDVDFYVSSVEYDKESVDVLFAEKTRYDYPEEVLISLSADLIDMEGEEWDSYIKGLTEVMVQSRVDEELRKTTLGAEKSGCRKGSNRRAHI